MQEGEFFPSKLVSLGCQLPCSYSVSLHLSGVSLTSTPPPQLSPSWKLGCRTEAWECEGQGASTERAACIQLTPPRFGTLNPTLLVWWWQRFTSTSCHSLFPCFCLLQFWILVHSPCFCSSVQSGAVSMFSLPLVIWRRVVCQFLLNVLSSSDWRQGSLKRRTIYQVCIWWFSIHLSNLPILTFFSQYSQSAVDCPWF